MGDAVRRTRRTKTNRRTMRRYRRPGRPENRLGPADRWWLIRGSTAEAGCRRWPAPRGRVATQRGPSLVAAIMNKCGRCGEGEQVPTPGRRGHAAVRRSVRTPIARARFHRHGGGRLHGGRPDRLRTAIGSQISQKSAARSPAAARTAGIGREFGDSSTTGDSSGDAWAASSGRRSTGSSMTAVAAGACAGVVATWARAAAGQCEQPAARNRSRNDVAACMNHPWIKRRGRRIRRRAGRFQGSSAFIARPQIIATAGMTAHGRAIGMGRRFIHVEFRRPTAGLNGTDDRHGNLPADGRCALASANTLQILPDRACSRQRPAQPVRHIR